MELIRSIRPLAGATAPLTALAVALLLVAAASSGGSEAALDASPFAVASSAVLLLALMCMAAASLGLAVQAHAAGRSAAAPVLAAVGTLLVAGGAWASLFVLPSLASAAPDVLDAGLGGVVVGYVASYAVLALGWASTGIAALRQGLLPTWLGVVLTATAVLTMVPSPEAFRLLPIGIAVTLVSRRSGSPAASQHAPVAA
jgi:hypothetical protein